MDLENNLQGLEIILKNKALSPIFQPIVDFKTEQVRGYEAFIRGPSNSPLHSAGRLFSTAAKHGLLFELEWAALELSFDQFGAMVREGVDGHKGQLFVNISTAFIVSHDFCLDRLQNLIHQAGLEPSQIVFEVPQTHNNAELKICLPRIGQLREIGVAVAIDDVGSGNTNLSLWAELRPEFLKIDHHFISSIDADPIKKQLVDSLMQLARSVGAEVIAEGIESVDELQTLDELHLTLGQGVVFGKPKARPAIHFPKWNPNLSGYRHINHFEDTAGALCHEVPVLLPQESLTHALEVFKQNPKLSSLPVVNGSKALGFIHRSYLLELFTTQYGKQIYSKKPCHSVVSENNLIIEADTPIDRVSERLTDEDDIYVRQHFIITDRGKYMGLGHTKDLLKRITERQLAQARYANPLTLLPGNIPINQHIEWLLDAGKPFTVGYVDLNYFKPFNDVYGYRKGDDIIRLVAYLLEKIGRKQDAFVGHVGGDDFVIAYQSLECESNAKEIIQNFDERMVSLLLPEHRATGYIETTGRDRVQQKFPLLSISIGLIPSTILEARTLEEISSLAAKAKKLAKHSDHSQVLSMAKDPLQQASLEFG